MNWKASCSDGKVLNQFEEQPFSVIDVSKVLVFEVETQFGKIIVDLKTGYINANGQVLMFGFEEEPKRLIYFKRNQQFMSCSGGNVMPPAQFEYVGWQATVRGANVKRIVRLTSRGVEVTT